MNDTHTSTSCGAILVRLGAAIAAAAILLSATAAAAEPERVSATQFTVIDGQTIEIAERRVTLDHIVAPQPGRMCRLADTERDCGVIARSALLDLTAGAEVTCAISTETNGAAHGSCSANGYDLGEGMVYTGWAVPADGAPSRYTRVLDEARARPRGFWRGTFVDPWPALDAALIQN